MKKGSLSLSVNAIVIFVLAFAMLGFGLFLINKLQDTTSPLIDEILTRDNWNPPPNSEVQIQTKGALEFKRGKDSTIGIAYYNKDVSGTFEPVKELKCNPPLSDNDPSKKITLTSLPIDIDSGEWQPFAITVHVGNGVLPKAYICNVGINKI